MASRRRPRPCPPILTDLSRTRKKSVSFSDYSELYYVSSAFDLSNEDFEAIYMNQNDYRRIRKDMNATLQDMKARGYDYHTVETSTAFSENKHGITRHYHHRGLEIQLPHIKARRKQRTTYLVNVVLQEQAEHNGKLHPEWVRQYLCPLTRPYAQAAHVMGVLDSQSVVAGPFMEVQLAMQKQNKTYQKSDNVFDTENSMYWANLHHNEEQALTLRIWVR